MLRDITTKENTILLEPQPFAFSPNSQIYYKEGQKVFKFHGTQHEVEMMLAAGDCSVCLSKRVLWVNADGTSDIWGLTMKCETPLDVAAASPILRRIFMHGIIAYVLALHARGIVHGDVKPTNMLLYSDSKIRLYDFAEARLIDEDPANWEGMTTTNYVAPQGWRNWPDSQDSPPVVEDDLYVCSWAKHLGTIYGKDAL